MTRTCCRAVLLSAALAIAAGACRSAPSDAGAGATASAAAQAPSPPDHLADGELVEGDGRAFDLALPRGLRVEGSFADVVFASGPLLVHPLVSYLRPRLLGGDLREGEKAATFEHVQVARKPGKKLTIHIASAPRETRLEIRDETPAPAQDLPDEAARWRAVGLTPDGHLADPTHME